MAGGQSGRSTVGARTREREIVCVRREKDRGDEAAAGGLASFAPLPLHIIPLFRQSMLSCVRSRVFCVIMCSIKFTFPTSLPSFFSFLTTVIYLCLSLSLSPWLKEEGGVSVCVERAGYACQI